MQNQSILDKSKAIFGKYSRKDTLYFTSDNAPFFDEGLANHHAAGLKNKTVESVSRDEAETTIVISLQPKSREVLLKLYLENFGKEAPVTATDDEISSAAAFNMPIENLQDQADADAKALAAQQAAQATADAQALIDAQAKADADAKALADQQAADAAKALEDAQAAADAQALADAQAKADADAKTLLDAQAKVDADKGKAAKADAAAVKV